jgi:adenylate cyclase
MIRLRCTSHGPEHSFVLSGTEIAIGREGSNAVVVADPSVSRHHAVFRRAGDQWAVEDQRSTNGVQVNGTDVERHTLRPGDVVKLGVFEWKVEAQEEPESETGPQPRRLDTLTGATIVRALADVSAQWGLDDEQRRDKRKQLDQAYGNRIFQTLTRLGRLLIRSDSIDDVLEKVVATTFEALPVDRCFVLLRDDDTGEIRCELVRVGEKLEFRPKTDVPVSKTIIDTVTRERVALLTYDAQTDERLSAHQSVVAHQIRAAMCTPLWSGERIIGVMQVDTPHHASAFTEQDVDLLTALANYAAVAVERIRASKRAAFERQLRARLERYHSPAVIEDVLRRAGGTDVEGMLKLRAAEATVFFADLVGFTSYAAAASLEEVAELLEGFFSQCVEAIFEEGGTLDKFIGDCTMAFFGAPVPQPDHAVRAVRAAIRIQQRVAAWNAERHARGLPEFAVRVSANSGPVVVGDVGSERRVDYTVLGNTVNLAARIEEYVAQPGDIVIGPETRRLLAGAIPSEPMGEFALKGLDEKVACFRVPH